MNSPHATSSTNLDDARDEVNQALSAGSSVTDMSSAPIQALNAQPLGNDLHPVEPPALPTESTEPPLPQPGPSSEPGPTLAEILGQSPIAAPPPALSDSPVVDPIATPQVIDPNAPPPVPPPIPFQFGNPTTS